MALSAARAATGDLEFKQRVPGLQVSAAASARAQLSASALDLGSSYVGDTASASVVLSNIGTAELVFSLPTVQGAGFGLSTNCASPLAPGASCATQVTFTPGSSGPATGSVSFGTAGSVSLSGTGLASLTVASFGSYRAWSDGSFAQSCAQYRAPSAGHSYSGSVGDGVYRIQPEGQSAVNVYCDMTTDAGGWTLIIHGGNPGSLTPAGWLVATSVNSGSLADASANAPASKHADVLIAALPKTAGYRFDIYGGTGAGTIRYINSACVYRHTVAPTIGQACNFSYATLAQAQAAGSTGRYGGGSKNWHFGFSDDNNTSLNSLYLITGHQYSGSDTALWYTGSGGAGTVTNAAQGGRFRVWVK